jgi:D-alanine-D-alanine ligase
VDLCSTADDLDVLVQKAQVSKALRQLGHEITDIAVTLNLQALRKSLKEKTPDFVFNLVEAIASCGQFIHFTPVLLETLSIPYSGASSSAIYVTTNKILAKERMSHYGIPTPAWTTGDRPDFDPPFIIKPVSEDASVDIDEDVIFTDPQELEASKSKFADKQRQYFIERYIAGREFNISLLASEKGPEVLPLAEIKFEGYPKGKPRIVGYRAKWDPHSFEYSHTVRNFDFPEDDLGLLDQLREFSLQCWRVFDLRGYARVDFRVDRAGCLWILEINANPSIAPDSGFVAAAKKAGISYERMVERIIADSMPVKRRRK